MTVEQYLNQGRYIDLMMDQELAQLQDLRAKSLTCKSPSFVQNLNTMPTTESRQIILLNRAMGLEEMLTQHMEVYRSYMRQREELISQIPDVDDRLIVKKHYYQGKTYSQIAEEMYASERTVRRRCGEAVHGIVLPPDAIVL